MNENQQQSAVSGMNNPGFVVVPGVPRGIFPGEATGPNPSAYLSHERLHDIGSILDHSSTATPGQILKANADGLPVDATNTDAEVAGVIAGQYRHTGNVLNAGIFTLPVIANGARGVMIVGTDEERADFSIAANGTVNLIMASSNVVANANTANKVCIGTSVASPCVIANNLGSTKAIMLQLWYD